MGCLVAKCALSNMALKEGQDVYINILSDKRVNNVYQKNIKLKNIKNGSVVEVKSTQDYNQGIQSTDYYIPVGILLKGTYEGWSSFVPDFNDDRTVKNFIRFVGLLEYDMTKQNSDEVIFSASELNRLVNENLYIEAWELIDDAMRISSGENLYIRNTHGLPQKVYYSAISIEAIDYIMKPSVQSDILKTFWRDETFKSINDVYDNITKYTEEVIAFDSEIYKGLKKSNISMSFVRCLFEGGRAIDTKLTSIWQTFNYDIFNDEFVDIIMKLDDDVEFTPVDYQTHFGELIKEMIFQNFINASFGYFNQLFMPVSNVNIEEYCNSYNIEALKMINYCLAENQKSWHEGYAFEGIVPITKKHSKFHAVYKHRLEKYDAYNIEAFNDIILKSDSSHTPDKLVFVGKRLEESDKDNIIYILNVKEKSYVECYESEVLKYYDVELI